MPEVGPAIILVNPQMGENIGMVARAMLNCGLTDLRLVAPRDGWPNDAARATASGAGSVVDGARVFDTLAAAMHDRTFAVATTARARDMNKPVLDPEGAARAIHAADHTAQKSTSAIVFGPERTGLENADILLCDVILNVPLNPQYMSLNIAQAVLLVAYQWYRAETDKNALEKAAKSLNIDMPDAATRDEFAALMAHMTDALDEAGFFPTPSQKPTMVTNLTAAFARMRPTKQEVNTLHGVIKALRGGKMWKAKN